MDSNSNHFEENMGDEIVLSFVPRAFYSHALSSRYEMQIYLPLANKKNKKHNEE